MKTPHWYLRNWEYEEQLENSGAVKRRLVYKGEYYQLSAAAMPQRRLKLVYFVLMVLLWTDLAVLLTHISRGANLFFVGGAAALALIPALYLAMGCVCLLRVPTRMTYRDLRGSYLRIRTAGRWITPMMAVSLAGELFFVVFRLVHGLAVDWPGESLWLAGTGIGTLIGALLLILYARERIEVLAAERGQ